MSDKKKYTYYHKKYKDNRYHYTDQKRWTSKNFVVIEYPIEEETLSRLEFVKMIDYHFQMQDYALYNELLLEDYKNKDVYMLAHNVDGKKISVDPKISNHGVKFKDYKPAYDTETWPIPNFIAQTNDTDEDGRSYHPDLLVVPPQNRRFRRNSKSISLLFWRNKLLLEKIPAAERELQKFSSFFFSLGNEERHEYRKKYDSLVKEVETLEKEFDELSPAPGKTYYYVLAKVNLTVVYNNALKEERAKKKQEKKDKSV